MVPHSTTIWCPFVCGNGLSPRGLRGYYLPWQRKLGRWSWTCEWSKRSTSSRGMIGSAFGPCNTSRLPSQKLQMRSHFDCSLTDSEKFNLESSYLHELIKGLIVQRSSVNHGLFLCKGCFFASKLKSGLCPFLIFADTVLLWQTKLELEKKLVLVDAKSCADHRRNSGHSIESWGHWFPGKTKLYLWHPVDQIRWEHRTSDRCPCSPSFSHTGLWFDFSASSCLFVAGRKRNIPGAPSKRFVESKISIGCNLVSSKFSRRAKVHTIPLSCREIGYDMARNHWK